MSNKVKWIVGIVGALLIGGILVTGGILIGQQVGGQQAASTAYAYGPTMAAALNNNVGNGSGMMQWDGDDDDDGDGDDYPYRMGPGMMGRGYGSGMMGRGGVGPGYMWDDDFEGGWPGYGMMGGVYQDEMHAVIADVLGLSVEDLEQAMWEDGKTVWQLADEQGISEDEFFAAMQEAHDAVLAQMVADGVLSQEQADWMGEHMAEGPYGPGNCPGWQTIPDDSTDI